MSTQKTELSRPSGPHKNKSYLDDLVDWMPADENSTSSASLSSCRTLRFLAVEELHSPRHRAAPALPGQGESSRGEDVIFLKFSSV